MLPIIFICFHSAKVHYIVTTTLEGNVKQDNDNNDDRRSMDGKNMSEDYCTKLGPSVGCRGGNWGAGKA